MKTTLHLLGAITATLCIATFFSATLFVELFGSPETIATVKKLIVMPGLLILIPAIAMTGATGFSLGKNRKGRLVEAKKKRMPIIGANGVLVLLPAAIFLDQWAAVGAYDLKFYVVQGLELIAGAVNLTLMGMNIRDGLKMTGEISPHKSGIRHEWR
ncbi:MAG: hypothetical protein KZQ85_15045 [Candidatus Thiodiazotropha sp. (ex Myrtea sp. 'scaly one' KF741663)]|nr:hypothetical protein [Candidatus Thiodiazotropha sp. (ex Myrtea sp. 'scaly one' KF741663)]